MTSGSASRSAPASAAIFDLDRTLLAGASWPILARALREAGVIGGVGGPLADGLFAAFRTIGETYLTMQLTRRAFSRARERAGINSAIRIAMIPITTRSSTSVKPRERRRCTIHPLAKRKATRIRVARVSAQDRI